MHDLKQIAGTTIPVPDPEGVPELEEGPVELGSCAVEGVKGVASGESNRLECYANDMRINYLTSCSFSSDGVEDITSL